MIRQSYSVFIVRDGVESAAGEHEITTETGSATEADALAAVQGELSYSESLRAYSWRGQLIPAASFGGLIVRELAVWVL